MENLLNWISKIYCFIIDITVNFRFFLKLLLIWSHLLLEVNSSFIIIKKVVRFYDKNSGYAVGDVIALKDEEISPNSYTIVDEHADFKRHKIDNYTLRELQVPIFINGRLVYNEPTLEETRKYAEEEFKTIYPESQRLYNPHVHHVGLSKELLNLKRNI